MTFWRETIRTFKTGWKYECVCADNLWKQLHILSVQLQAIVCCWKNAQLSVMSVFVEPFVLLTACDVVCNSMYQCIGFRERKGHAASNKLEDVVNDLILPRRKWIGKFVLNLCLLQVQQNARAATRKKVFIFTLLCHNLCLPPNEHLLMWSQRFNVSPGYLCKL